MNIAYRLFLLSLMILLSQQRQSHAFTILWDFESPGSPPPDWTNGWGCIEFEGCDSQNRSWEANSGTLVAPLYDPNGDGPMNTFVESPSFKSFPSLGTSHDGESHGPLLRFLINYDLDALGAIDDENKFGDKLIIDLITIGSAEEEGLFNEPLNLAGRWQGLDQEDGNLNEVIVVTEEIDVNVEYRLRVRAQDNDIDISTFSGISIDDVAVTNGVIVVPGDFDADGDVDGFDFLRWQLGQSQSPLSGSDLADWQSNYGSPGSTSLSAINVPEPSSLLLLALFLLGTSQQKRILGDRHLRIYLPRALVGLKVISYLGSLIER